MQIAERANTGKKTGAAFFLDLENAVLKSLNDEVVKDKDLVTALTNLHKDVIWRALMADERIAPYMLSQYSDFKSIRIAFSEDNPRLRHYITERIREKHARYQEHVEELFRKNGWDRRARGLATDSRNWFHGGFGKSPDEAGLAGRYSRVNENEEFARVQEFYDAIPGLERAAKSVERESERLQRRYGKVAGFLAAGEPAGVLSAEAIEAVKKAPSAAEIPAVLRARFGVNIDDKEAQRLLNLLKEIDRFSPGLLLAEREVIDLGLAAHGVVSADFKGQNARNFEETMRALLESKGKTLEERVRAVRAGEQRATAALDAKKARFQKVIASFFPGHRGQFSGDDGILTLPRAFTREEQKLFIRRWLAEGGAPEDLRLTFEQFRYADTGREIAPALRSELVVAAESVEKSLRAGLLGVLNRAQLNGTVLAVELTAREQGQGSVRLLVGGGQNLPEGWRQAAERIVAQKGYRLEAVETAR